MKKLLQPKILLLVLAAAWLLFVFFRSFNTTGST